MPVPEVAAHERALEPRVHAEQDEQAAGHVLAEEVTRLAAADHDRPQVLVGLHVDADAVADVALDEDLAAAHAVAEHVAGVAVDDDLAGVHGVADAVLRVAEDLERSDRP